MIVVNVMGGLGNQMFQYAFGRAISIELDRSLVLDLSRMPTGRPPFVRGLELHRLPISQQMRFFGKDRRNASVAGGGPPRVRRFHRLVAAASRRFLSRWWVEEPHGDAKLEMERVPVPLAVCHGYWQSPSYFESIAGRIRRELTPTVEHSSPVHDLLKRFSGREKIAVHVRRGDYLHDSQVRATHGLQRLTYHREAVNLIASTAGKGPVALILSDDPAWVREHLEFDIESVHVEARQPLTALQSLGVMSNCQHHVIANSSFSWWGAWLAEHPDQRVVYPRKWFASRDVDPRFRFPVHWIAQ